MGWRPLLRRLFCAEPESFDPGEGERPLDLASPRARLVAAAIDVSLMVSALFWVGALGHDPAFGGHGPPLRIVARLLAWVVVLGHLVLLEGSSGQTFGKRLVGIRVVSEDTGGPIGYWAAAHRAGARALFWFVSFLALADGRMRTLHDRSAGTVVVNVSFGARSVPTWDRLEVETTDDT